MTCGSVWVCPVCSAKILARRSLEFSAILLAHENAGGSVVFGTNTMRHDQSHSLVDEWDALQRAWGSMTKHRVWGKWKDRLGAVGHLRVVEVTYGRNGWHVHTHWALLIDGRRTELVGDFGSWAVEKWRRGLAVSGFDAHSVGQDIRTLSGLEAVVNLGDYFAKNTCSGGSGEGIGRELFGSWTKNGRSTFSTRPAWWLLDQFAQTGDAECLSLWREYERASRGRRQMNLSRGLRERFGLLPEQSDEDIAAESHEGDDIVRITVQGWRDVQRRPWSEVRILDVLEHGGPDELVRFLNAESIEHEVLTW